MFSLLAGIFWDDMTREIGVKIAKERVVRGMQMNVDAGCGEWGAAVTNG